MLAFFSRKLNKVWQKYSVTKQELLVTVETPKEFKGMLWGQHIIMYINHKTSSRMLEGLPLIEFTAGDYSWRNMASPLCMLWESTTPVVDAIPCLDYGPIIMPGQRGCPLPNDGVTAPLTCNLKAHHKQTPRNP